MKFIYEAVNPWWQGKDFDAGIAREHYLGDLSARLGRDRIEIFIGGRGSGKTTLLMQIVKRLLKSGRPAKAILYLPMNYPALRTLTLEEHIWDVEMKLFGGRGAVRFLIVDDFQDVTIWDMEVKRLYNLDKYKIFAAATVPPPVPGPGRISRRKAVTTVYPLNFREFIQFRGIEPDLGDPDGMAALADSYLLTGGYPSQVQDPISGDLAALLAGTAVGDIEAIHDIRKPYLLKDILRRLTTAVGAGITFRQLAAPLRLADDTLSQYIGFLEEVWCLKSLEKWGATPAERRHAPKKIYLGDNGIRTLLLGDLAMAIRAENAVFLEIWHRGIPCGYGGENRGDLDFVLGPRARPLPLDVRYETAPDGEAGRYDAIQSFLSRHPRTRQAIVVTRNVEETLRIGRVVVRALPLWNFLWDVEAQNLR